MEKNEQDQVNKELYKYLRQKEKQRRKEERRKSRNHWILLLLAVFLILAYLFLQKVNIVWLI